MLIDFIGQIGLYQSLKKALNIFLATYDSIVDWRIMTSILQISHLFGRLLVVCTK